MSRMIESDRKLTAAEAHALRRSAAIMAMAEPGEGKMPHVLMKSAVQALHEATGLMLTCIHAKPHEVVPIHVSGETTTVILHRLRGLVLQHGWAPLHGETNDKASFDAQVVFEMMDDAMRDARLDLDFMETGRLVDGQAIERSPLDTVKDWVKGTIRDIGQAIAVEPDDSGAITLRGMTRDGSKWSIVSADENGFRVSVASYVKSVLEGFTTPEERAEAAAHQYGLERYGWMVPVSLAALDGYRREVVTLEQMFGGFGGGAAEAHFNQPAVDGLEKLWRTERIEMAIDLIIRNRYGAALHFATSRAAFINGVALKPLNDMAGDDIPATLPDITFMAGGYVLPIPYDAVLACARGEMDAQVMFNRSLGV